ncbi:MAG: cytochrome C biogenesis protein [Gemmatimonadetes bacterium]|uniref:Cytochrome C biogenesis protein n=1 Tax=Candidatus Kutchimonas denitrificans TaxID=3056748 RepID=A0AAE5CDR8_9BACT|nr:cytochrome C biogenesis protein [Gemmatimonadota bacterium]NIR76454.1 cytochrome C biogenesis protein [Candidatus Kutchimonas denitrificans]NIS03272.1 cytochrome C biogenesis protein [Gemmatimonadota bacterium]NIT69133.1 cytochrome C biogenesis protein [Gemmatimonadota bacterium]NIU54525.1 cytochrome C biogenesis protein [Gemmatimonadota bacterium]
MLGPEAMEVLQSVSITAFAVVFAAGFAMGLAPSSYALYPVIAGFVAGDEERSGRRAVSLSAAFVVGTATVDAVLGALFGFVGGIVIEAVANYLVLWNLLAAAILTVFGLALLRLVTIRWPVVRMSWRKAHSVPGAYALGIPFGLTACPACTPMVLPMLGAAAVTGSWWFGAALMFVFGLARGLPLLLVGTGAGVLGRLQKLSRWMPRVERVAGVVLLLGAVFFLVSALWTAWVSWA